MMKYYVAIKENVVIHLTRQGSHGIVKGEKVTKQHVQIDPI